jgi:outer membrane protein assembly factor BamB
MSRLLALATLVAAAGLAGASDWPQFRGPNRDDISTEKGLLDAWPKEGPRLLWKGTGLGQGFSTVAVAGDKVFTMGDKDGSCFVFALDRATGKVLWEAKVGRAASPGGFPGPRGTPTVDGALVYALGQLGDLVCLDAASGAEKWRKDFAKDYKGQVGGWRYSESPLIDGDRLVCTPGGRSATLVALNKRTGEEVWRSGLNFRAGYSSIVISQACGIKQYVQLLDTGGVVGVSAADGKLLWRYEKLAPNVANIPTPIVLGNQVFCSAGYGKGGALLTLRPDGKGGVRAEEEYYNPRLRNKHGGLVVVGAYVYGDTDDSGRPFCAEWKTGEVKWTKGRSRGNGSASLTYADGHLYVRYANGYVALVPAEASGYREKGIFKIPNGDRNSWSHPVVVDGRLYLREKDTLWVYDVKAR